MIPQMLRTRPIRNLAMVAAAVLSAAPAVLADPPASNGGGAIYRYTDAQGDGTIRVIVVGTDPATGAQQILVSIDRNGVQYNGSGLVSAPGSPPPYNNQISFTVQSPDGTAYHYVGTLTGGAQVQGQGIEHQGGPPPAGVPCEGGRPVMVNLRGVHGIYHWVGDPVDCCIWTMTP
jgi:hypothetical protein